MLNRCVHYICRRSCLPALLTKIEFADPREKELLYELWDIFKLPPDVVSELVDLELVLCNGILWVSRYHQYDPDLSTRLYNVLLSVAFAHYFVLSVGWLGRQVCGMCARIMDARNQIRL